MKYSEITLSIMLAAFAASISVGAIELKYSDQYSFGPGFVPLTVGLLLLLCCFLQLVRACKREGGDNSDDQVEKPNFRGLLITIAILSAGISAMAFGAVLIPLIGIVFLISWLVSGHTLAMSAIISVVTTLVIYVIFSIWLGLPVQ
ncbi:tripartite tricarboxylate transporter TctB family protein [Salinicola corii]|uniref:Tripartite tricarboxylate transporter TctB family protein n=1 Tax=Salinicola corii TaxID=2606937 RepID=A0A640WFA6_9GAMM|nr:tripartite tricarboxylate transporter TctB family protein [Salinicola corii]KAA0018827.1 tripartite tricarboxylate transporter TctB family protein [Salinicola corii]